MHAVGPVMSVRDALEVTRPFQLVVGEMQDAFVEADGGGVALNPCKDGSGDLHISHPKEALAPWVVSKISEDST